MKKAIQVFLDAVDLVLNSQSFFIVIDVLDEYIGETNTATLQSILFSKEFDQQWAKQDKQREWNLFEEWQQANPKSNKIKQKVELDIELLEGDLHNYWMDLLMENSSRGFFSPYQKGLTFDQAQQLVERVVNIFDCKNGVEFYKISPNFLYTVGNKNSGLGYFWNCGLDTVSAIYTSSKIGILLTNGSS